MTALSLRKIVKVTNNLTHKCDHDIDRVVVRPDDDIHDNYAVTDSLVSDNY